ncbi:hypothetical protein TWF788_009734 [Orbilia oligospora]|uniref:Uncharacterized protein n=1 Tax=Orbilia oligospora TaxID=2813651 RepID=A0A7C8Q204_ORBOL|nr:hypothetical protein TWF788_009734 [Orbilia oligospora]
MTSQDQLKIKVEGIKKSLEIASDNFSTLELEGDRDISAKFWELHYALFAASNETSAKNKETSPQKTIGFPAPQLAQFPIRNQHAPIALIEYSLSSTIKDLDVTIRRADSLLQRAMHYDKMIMEFRNEHLTPRLQNDIASTHTEAENLKVLMTKLLVGAEKELRRTTLTLEGIRTEIAKKEEEIRSNRETLQQNRADMFEIKIQIGNAESAQMEYERLTVAEKRAAAERRWGAVVFGTLTLGIGLIYAGSTLVNTLEEDERAETYAAKAESFANQARKLRSSYNALGSSISSLKAPTSRLKSEKKDLVQKLKQIETHHTRLLSNVSRLQGEAPPTITLSKDMIELGLIHQKLSTNLEEARRNLQVLKANVSELRDTLTQYRDAVVMAERKPQ